MSRGSHYDRRSDLSYREQLPVAPLSISVTLSRKDHSKESMLEEETSKVSRLLVYGTSSIDVLKIYNRGPSEVTSLTSS